MWEIFKKKSELVEETKKDPRANHTFDDEDRQHSQLMRSMNRDMRRMEMEMQRLEMKRRLQDLKDELYGSDDEEEDESGIENQLLGQILAPVLAGKMGSAQQSPQQQPTQEDSNRPALSDEDLRQMIATVPKTYIKIAKKMPKEAVFRQVLQKYPMLTGEELERGYNLLIKEF